MLVTHAILRLNTITETLAVIINEIQCLSTMLLEYDVVMNGVGDTLGPQLMAEIGDVRRFYSKKALVAFASLDSPPYQSGCFEAQSRSIFKRGSASLRKLFFKLRPASYKQLKLMDPFSNSLIRSVLTEKNFYIYLMAGANKLLRIYCACVKEHLNQLEKHSLNSFLIHSQHNKYAVVVSFVMAIFILLKMFYLSS